MASIKIKFRTSSKVGNEGVVYYQVIKDRRIRQLTTNYRIFGTEWDVKRSSVRITAKSERKTYLLSIRQCIHWDMERLAKIMRKFERRGILYSVDDIIEEYKQYTNEYTLFNYMESIIMKFRQNGNIRTSETYTSTLNSFKNFRKNEDILLDRITSDIMEAYESWQRKRGITPNTISFYTRILRAVYKRAVENEITDDHYPFRHVYTGIEKTTKRALPLNIIKRIKALDLSENPKLDFARDMFILSFMLRGMSFIDMAYLRKNDLSNGYITYRRRKTGQALTIQWTKDMQTILNKYPDNKSDFLLPIIIDADIDERRTYRKVGYRINHYLKSIGKMMHLKAPLTLYVARHSWASAAKNKGIPLSVISEGMGHENEMTTRIYLASLDTSAVNKANALILKGI